METTTRSGEDVMTQLEFDCPWCAGPMASIDAATQGADETLACATCSIVVDLAPDPVAAMAALAA